MKFFKNLSVLSISMFCFTNFAFASDVNPVIPTKQEIEVNYSNQEPTEWGEHLNSVISKIDTTEKIVALTFDACRGTYDESLINFLVENQIPATIFMTGRWINTNPEYALYLAKQNNFKLENHGYSHRPLCVNGRAAYGIEGTKNAGEAYDEVIKSSEMIQELTGKKPKFFRSGTAFYDDVALRILEDLGVKAAGYTIAGDEGATLQKEKILKKCSNPENGAILLFHMNHPECDTGIAIEVLIPELLQKGFKFLYLEDVV